MARWADGSFGLQNSKKEPEKVRTLHVADQNRDIVSDQGDESQILFQGTPWCCAVRRSVTGQNVLLEFARMPH